jgi:hypothetical protein
MSRWTLKLAPWNRDRAIEWLDKAIANGEERDWWSLIICDTRTDKQNRKLWPMLADVAKQVEWFGQKLPKEDWKLIFLAALNREVRIVPNLENNGFVNLGASSSKLSKGQFADLIELIYKFGAERKVEWSDPNDRKAALQRAEAA